VKKLEEKIIGATSEQQDDEIEREIENEQLGFVTR
jgi:hypothetical protein